MMQNMQYAIVIFFTPALLFDMSSLEDNSFNILKKRKEWRSSVLYHTWVKTTLSLVRQQLMGWILDMILKLAVDDQLRWHFNMPCLLCHSLLDTFKSWPYDRAAYNSEQKYYNRLFPHLFLSSHSFSSCDLLLSKLSFLSSQQRSRYLLQQIVFAHSPPPPPPRHCLGLVLA